MSSKKTNIFIQLGFVVSLILNGFLIGLLMSGPSGHRPPPPDPSKRLYEAAAHLPPNSQAKVMPILERHTAAMGASMHKGMDDFKNIRHALTQPNLDSKELNIILDRMTSHHETMGSFMQEMFKEIVQALPDSQERAVFFKYALPPEPPFSMRPPPPESPFSKGPPPH